MGTSSEEAQEGSSGGAISQTVDRVGGAASADDPLKWRRTSHVIIRLVPSRVSFMSQQGFPIFGAKVYRIDVDTVVLRSTV